MRRKKLSPLIFESITSGDFTSGKRIFKWSRAEHTFGGEVLDRVAPSRIRFIKVITFLILFTILTRPISAVLVLSLKDKRRKLFFSITSITILLALILTNSLSGFIGTSVAAFVLLVLSKEKINKSNLKFIIPVVLLLLSILVINGNALLIRLGDSTSKAAQILKSRSITTIETPRSAGTPSFLIRLIVWQGSLDVIKRYPIFGSGPETFVYSYYQSKPTLHNKTSEFNFFYNKAHNEILNTFANTGIFGILTFLAFIIFVVAFLLKQSLKKSDYKEIYKASLAAILGYFVSILFGFSVVATQTVMFLIIASALILAGKTDPLIIGIKALKKAPVKNITLLIIVISGFYLLTLVGRMYFADILFQRARDTGFGSQSLVNFSNAISTFPAKNPFYLSEAAYSTAVSAANTTDPEFQQIMENRTKAFVDSSLSSSPQNLLIVRRAANSYFLLATFNPQNEQSALEIASKLIILAPTDPQSYLGLAKIQAGLGKEKEAEKTLQKTLELKPDYQEALDLQDQLKSENIDN